MKNFLKRCRACSMTKLPVEFYDGRGRCIACVRAVERERYWRNRAARLAAANAYWRRTQTLNRLENGS